MIFFRIFGEIIKNLENSLYFLKVDNIFIKISLKNIFRNHF